MHNARDLSVTCIVHSRDRFKGYLLKRPFLNHRFCWLFGFCREECVGVLIAFNCMYLQNRFWRYKSFHLNKLQIYLHENRSSPVICFNCLFYRSTKSKSMRYYYSTAIFENEFSIGVRGKGIYKHNAGQY